MFCEIPNAIATNDLIKIDWRVQSSMIGGDLSVFHFYTMYYQPITTRLLIATLNWR